MLDCGAVSFEVFTADVRDRSARRLAKVQHALELVAEVGRGGRESGDQSLLSHWATLPLLQRIGFEDFRPITSTVPPRPWYRKSHSRRHEAQAVPFTYDRSTRRAGVEVIRRLKDLCDVTVETTVQCMFFDQGVYK